MKTMQYFTNDRPVGPNQTPEIIPDDLSSVQFQKLFDRENEIYESLSRNPRILVGRRGSGKTAFLKSRNFVDGKDICVELNSAKAFSHVVRSINELMQAQSISLPEETSQIWNGLFSMIMFRTMIREEDFRNEEEIKIISKYFYSIFGDRNIDQFNLFFTTLARELLTKATGLTDIWEFIRLPSLDGPSQQDAVDAAVKIFHRQGKCFQILIDNLEDFKIEDYSMRAALTGLLKSIREFSDMQSNCFGITFCIPAELFHIFQSELSANPLKDFENRQLLQWSGKELIHLAASRYAYFLELFEKDFYDRNLANLDLSEHNQAKEFWGIVFPEKITNGNGIEEDALGYVLRHTQLSPRQLIMLLNEIISHNIFKYGSRWNINNESFVTGIANIEPILCEEAFRGFRDTYPTASALCEMVLPHVSTVLDYSTLHSTYNTYGKGVPDVEGFATALRLLIEIGAVGLVTPKEETARYTVGTFEYTLPNKLIVNSTDELCIHPIFTRRFRVNTEGVKPVYPYGADLDGYDYRTWTKRKSSHS